jgi:hypothetical protein
MKYFFITKKNSLMHFKVIVVVILRIIRDIKGTLWEIFRYLILRPEAPIITVL